MAKAKKEPETLAEIAKEQTSLHKLSPNELRALVASKYGDYDDKATKEELIKKLEK